MSAQPIDINVQNITRVEGHGNVVLSARDGEIKECRLEITEEPRYFEAMLRGRYYDEAMEISCRLCGICSVGHSTTSLRATEKAFGVEITPQAKKLRYLNFYGEQLQSHFLHYYFLVAPDFFNAPSVIPLLTSHPDVAARALRLKKLANFMCDSLCGRKIHACAMMVGGWSWTPTTEVLQGILDELEACWPDMEETVNLFESIKGLVPDYERPTDYISVWSPDEYGLYEGEVMSHQLGKVAENDYLEFIKERCCRYSNAKWSGTPKSPSYQVGAMARLNNSYDLLRPETKKVAERLGFTKIPCHNPYMISFAQVVESYEWFLDSIDVTKELIETIQPEDPVPVTPKAGRGVGVCDVPRGILFHDYTYDENGYMKEANLVIPTNQNLANIEDDLKGLAPKIINEPPEDIRKKMEMLVRAYDPCISCATHLIDLKIVDD